MQGSHPEFEHIPTARRPEPRRSRCKILKRRNELLSPTTPRGDERQPNFSTTTMQPPLVPPTGDEQGVQRTSTTSLRRAWHPRASPSPAPANSLRRSFRLALPHIPPESEPGRTTKQPHATRTPRRLHPQTSQKPTPDPPEPCQIRQPPEPTSNLPPPGSHRRRLHSTQAPRRRAPTSRGEEGRHPSSNRRPDRARDSRRGPPSRCTRGAAAAAPREDPGDATHRRRTGPPGRRSRRAAEQEEGAPAHHRIGRAHV